MSVGGCGARIVCGAIVRHAAPSRPAMFFNLSKPPDEQSYLHLSVVPPRNWMGDPLLSISVLPGALSKPRSRRNVHGNDMAHDRLS